LVEKLQFYLKSTKIAGTLHSGQSTFCCCQQY